MQSNTAAQDRPQHNWLPSLSHSGQREFQGQKAEYWDKYTGVFLFISSLQRKLREAFAYRIATDGESVSVIFQRQSAEGIVDSTVAETNAALKSNPVFQRPSDKDWVIGPPRPKVSPTIRLVGVDPGRKAVFTAATSTYQALQEPQPVRNTRYAISFLDSCLPATLAVQSYPCCATHNCLHAAQVMCLHMHRHA